MPFSERIDAYLASRREDQKVLVEALHVAPFISADESLVRCRQGADEIGALMRENDALRRENTDLREDLSIAKARSIVRGHL